MMMDSISSIQTPQSKKSSPYSGGKRKRKQRAKLAAAKRWQNGETSDSLDSTGEALASVSEDAHMSDTNDAVQANVQNLDQLCTSRKKLAMMDNSLQAEAVDVDEAGRDRCIVELDCLSSFFRAVRCSDCAEEGTLVVSFGDKMGFSREIQVVCKNCVFRQCMYSCGRSDNSQDITAGFDVNSSVVMAFNELGCGFVALRKFSALVNIPCMAHSTYRRLTKKVGKAHIDVAADVLTAAVEAVRDRFEPEVDNGQPNNGQPNNVDPNIRLQDNEQPNNVDPGGSSDSDDSDSSNSDGDGGDNDVGGVVDVKVSFDGTWHKRGFTSNYGVGIVIDIVTGLVLDYEVLSKYCPTCVASDKRHMTPEERADWERDHQPHCSKNFEGSSKAMEKEAALRMWRRSIDKNKMRYTSMLSDGDSVAYRAIVSEKIYPVQKLECVNHVDKRLGTALRKITKEKKLGGRRRGALTVNACNVLQSYYRNAILKNLGNPDKMREAIWATFMHCTSTDEEPHHLRCPRGEDSWCFYNRALARGERPPPHDQHVGTSLAYDVARSIRPIYERMSQPALLDKMQHGRTQNANECVNGQIWSRCPKTVFVGAERVNAAVASAVSHFNKGSAHLSHVMQRLDVSQSLLLETYQQRQNTKRCNQADMASQVAAKRARKKKTCGRRVALAAQEEAEGDTYGPGLLADD